MVSTAELYRHFLNHPVICTDTRAITPGCFFFALKGERFNANTFAAKALELGAAYAVIDEEAYADGDRYLLTANVLEALQDLARHHRRQLNIPVIGLTGSNGKTTTKELIHAVLSAQFKTFATKGNLNNHIGVPLSVLSITPETEMAVIEMGANHQKEIGLLCTIAQPTHGLITNIGMAHLDGFGGFEGVKKGKGELYAWLKASDGVTFINSGNIILEELCETSGIVHRIGYGSKADDLVHGELLGTDPFLKMSWSADSASSVVSLHITGAYNFENALAAICIGHYFKMPADAINRGIQNYKPVNNRSQIISTARNTVICDFYNANPSSMLAAIANLAALQNERKAAILGDMFELGSESAEQHALIRQGALDADFDQVIFIGHTFCASRAKEDHALYFETRAAAAAYLQENPIAQTLVLLKGSRGMALEQLLALL